MTIAAATATLAAPRLIPQPKSLKLDRGRRTLKLAVRLGGGLERDLADLRKIARVELDPVFGPEAYALEITPDGVILRSSSEIGARHGIITLLQLARQYGGEVPCLSIDDSPDFAKRGFMLDVSRGKVPTLKTLIELAELLSYLKYNHLELYVEHTYAFKKHPLFGRGHSPLTAKEIRSLDDACARMGIELTPNLQSFGHAWHILRHKKYAHLAESDYRGGWTLSPVEPGTYDLLREMFDEFLPNFRHTDLFNVGCDETWDLAKGKSADLAKKIGVGGVYIGHVLEVHKLARDRKRRMMFWGDIIAHYPKLLPQIPKDVILLNWGYDAHGQERDYRKRLAPAAKSGLEHWVCPGTSCWNSLFFRMENARVNLRQMALEGKRAGAAGYLVTEWGDNGHYNFLGADYWPLAYGADCAWRAREDKAAEAEFDARFCEVMLDDAEGRFIKPLRLLGGVYQDLGVLIPNASAERWLLTGNPRPEIDILGTTGELTAYNKIGKAAIRKALASAERAATGLRAIKAKAAADLVRREWLLSAELITHACRRALLLNHGQGDAKALRSEIAQLARRFDALWLARNKESDLDRNREDFAHIGKQYAARKPEKMVF